MSLTLKEAIDDMDAVVEEMCSQILESRYVGYKFWFHKVELRFKRSIARAVVLLRKLLKG